MHGAQSSLVPRVTLDPAVVAQSQRGNEASATRGKAEGEQEGPGACREGEIPKEMGTWRLFCCVPWHRGIPCCSELAAGELCLLFRGKARTMQLKAASLGKELVFVASSLKGRDRAMPDRPWITQRSPRGKVGRRFGCLIPCGMLRTAGKPSALQLESAGSAAGRREGRGGSGWLLQHLPFAQRAGRAAGGERVSAGPQEAGLSFPPRRHPLAGHQPVLEGRGSGGRGSHYRAASPLRLCPCVPALQIGLRHPHKAPAMHYSAAVLP